MALSRRKAPQTLNQNVGRRGGCPPGMQLAVNEIVTRFKEENAKFPGEIELEARLGSCVGETFCPGVQREVFQQLEKDMLEDCRLTTHETWSEIVDYHYIGLDGHPMRTRVTVNSNDMTMQKQHIRKVDLYKALVRCPDCSEDVARLTLSREIPVLKPPSSCVPTHIRIKQRRRFEASIGGKVTWIYELSRTWSANTRSAVEHKQHMNEPIYEVECELVDEEGCYTKGRSN